MTQDQHMLELFYRVAHTINSSLDLDTTLQAILQAVRDALKVDLVTVRLLSPDANALEPVASIGVSMADLAALPIGRAASMREPAAKPCTFAADLALPGCPSASGGCSPCHYSGSRDRVVTVCADQCGWTDTLTPPAVPT
jgi:GAF domain-containing protein